MSVRLPPADQPRGFAWRLLPLVVIVVLSAVAYFAVGEETISLHGLVRHRMAIFGFVSSHRMLALLTYIGIYIVTVAVSVPGAAFLTVAGGFLFGPLGGAAAAVVGATIGATLIFLVARTALGEPLRKAFVTTLSATFSSCGWCRYFRSSWSTWCRLSLVCVSDHSLPRLRSASSLQPSYLRWRALASTA
jgi:hypothetical protein